MTKPTALHLTVDQAGGPAGLAAPRPVGIVGRTRGLLGNPLDGRFGPLHPSVLVEAIAGLVERFDLTGVDCVIGLPEGGVVPAYAFAAACNLPLVVGSLHRFDLPGVVSFTEQHSSSTSGVAISICGLVPGSRAIVVEDELTTGKTIVNCVRALRAAEVRCDQVATIYAVDDPALGARLAEEAIEFHAAFLFPTDVRDRLTTGPK
jgi:adenine phosphoribosyltransferase